ncbi:MAG: helix-hairpin-helix domain-containing protein [Proteobacteria bacterium]|nr:helix-hairpin-helix domain-containing protein [Pseudomonadota bacterium]
MSEPNLDAPRLLQARRTLRPHKARHAGECQTLEQLPNIGPALAADLRLLGVLDPRELAARDAFVLYQSLCSITGQRQDPCVLDSFMAATDFMRGAEARPWWTYTAQRKTVYGAV